jgi:NAD(P)H dehydrogenase (quinone)
MKVTVILAHPDKKSFNHAIFNDIIEELKDNNTEVYAHDLYAENFDPRLNTEEILRDAELPDAIKKHCDEIRTTDGIIIIHPNWWGMPPALLKGWIDRVIRPGVAYEFIGDDKGEGVPKGLLKVKFALVFNTGNTFLEREKEVFGDPLETIWKNCVFGLCGVNNFKRKLFTVVITSTEEERKNWLNEARKIVREHLK